MSHKPGVLAVGNFDSNIGYAWRLMEKLWCELSGYMGNRGYSMHLCFPTVSLVPQCLQENNFEVNELDFNDTSLIALYRQARFIRTKSIKVLYLTDFPTSSLRYLFYRMAGARQIIVHDHTPGVRTRPTILKGLLKSVANRLPWVSCSACFAVSPYVAQRLKNTNCVPEEKIYCVTNGIDIISDMPSPERKQASVNVVTVARANYYKGIDFAIRVVAMLVHQEELTCFRYTLYGDGPDLKTFQDLAKSLDVEGVVEFRGAVKDVPDRLASCDIAFHPSKGEAMSLAILEYMRAGLPILVSNNPSVSSALIPGKTALVYEEGSPGDAAEKLKQLIQSPETRREIGSAARGQVEKEFSTAAMSQRFISALNSVIN